MPQTIRLQMKFNFLITEVTSEWVMIFIQPFLVKLSDHFSHIEILIIFHPIVKIMFVIIIWKLKIFDSVDSLLKDKAIKKS